MMRNFPRLAEWRESRANPGISQGWFGWAWVWLRLSKLGVIEDDRRVRAAIRNQILNACKFPSRTGEISHLVGSGAVPVMAAVYGALCPDDSEGLLEGAISNWIASSAVVRHHDMMRGSAGALLAAVEVNCHAQGKVPRPFIERWNSLCIDEVKRMLSIHRREPVLLGLAHGLAGYLLALEMSKYVFGTSFDSSLRNRAMDLLASERIELSVHRACAWPVRPGETVRIHGWCHGGPGIGLALLYCYKVSGIERYLKHAKLGLEGASELKSSVSSFCCGNVGRAQILIEAYRCTGDVRWLRKARLIARTIRVRKGDSAFSWSEGLWRGRLGRLFLKWRLQYPQALPLPCTGIFSN